MLRQVPQTIEILGGVTNFLIVMEIAYEIHERLESAIPKTDLRYADQLMEHGISGKAAVSLMEVAMEFGWMEDVQAQGSYQPTQAFLAWAQQDKAARSEQVESALAAIEEHGTISLPLGADSQMQSVGESTPHASNNPATSQEGADYNEIEPSAAPAEESAAPEQPPQLTFDGLDSSTPKPDNAPAPDTPSAQETPQPPSDDAPTSMATPPPRPRYGRRRGPIISDDLSERAARIERQLERALDTDTASTESAHIAPPQEPPTLPPRDVRPPAAPSRPAARNEPPAFPLKEPTSPPVRGRPARYGPADRDLGGTATSQPTTPVPPRTSRTSDPNAGRPVTNPASSRPRWGRQREQEAPAPASTEETAMRETLQLVAKDLLGQQLDLNLSLAVVRELVQRLSILLDQVDEEVISEQYWNINLVQLVHDIRVELGEIPPKRDI